jgi:hypothetical protein
MNCGKCGCFIPDNVLHCFSCLQRLAHQDLLKRQPQWLAKRLPLNLARPSGPSRLHIECFNGPGVTYCGQMLTAPIRRERWTNGYVEKQLPVELCPECKKALQYLLMDPESNRDL